MYRWDWINDSKLPHGGVYVVKRPDDSVLCQTGPFKADYEEAIAIAAAMNQSNGSN
jgi:hypothetical protein